MGKVTYSGLETYNQTQLYTPPHSHNVIDVVGKDDDSETYSEETPPEEFASKSESYEQIKSEKEEILNNNDQQPLEVTT